MRWLSLFASSLLAAGGLAAKEKKATTDPFTTFHAKSLSSTPVKLDDATYKKLTAGSRDYTAAVLLTAMDARFGCQLCREFQPEWDLLSRSWIKGDKAGKSRLVFSTLDFSDGRDTFMALGLQTAPVLLLFQPTTGPHAGASPEAIRYDFTSGPQTAEQVHSWISRYMAGRPQPPLRRPINYLRWFTTITMFLGATTVLFVAWPYVVPVFTNRNLWAAGSLIAILLFTSGHMFNHIRKVPYVSGDGKGGITYFANGFQSQFGLETQIVAAIYGVLSFAAISLTLKAPRIADPKRQQFAIFLWCGILFVAYSFLLSVFRIKNGGYPFYLPPFF